MLTGSCAQGISMECENLIFKVFEFLSPGQIILLGTL